MEVLYPRCCGLDVHKKTVTACLITPGPKGERHKEVRTFGTMTEDLLALADWLVLSSCTHVAMESTGVYWKPIYNLLGRDCNAARGECSAYKEVKAGTVGRDRLGGYPHKPFV